MNMKTTVGLIVGILLAAGMVTAAVTYTPVSGEQALQANSDATIVIDGASELNLSQPFINDSAIRVETSSGNLTMVGSGQATATVAASDIEGATTMLTDIDASTSPLTINPDDKPAFTVGRSIDSVTVHAGLGLDDGNTDVSYSGPDGTESRLTLRGLPAGQTVGAIDATSGELLDVATVDASGILTFDALSNSAHDVLLQTTDGGPSVTNGSPDASTVYTADPQLQIDVSDPDFPSDNVTLEWSVDGSVVKTTYATSDGTYSTTLSGIADGSHDWSVTATDAYGNTQTSATYSFTVDHYDPVVADITPTGVLNDRPTEISANISDADFGGDGDSLSVSISLDGSQIATQTLSSNATITEPMPEDGRTGGNHTLTISVTDDYGQTTTQSTQYTVPATLTIYNETNPQEIVDNTSVKVRFFKDDTVFEETTTNGNVSLAGLPVSSDMTITITADNYVTRTTYIESIYNQQRVYALPTTATKASLVFELDDQTGDFPSSQSTLRIQRPITRDHDGDGSVETRYDTVAGGTFGASGQFPTELVGNGERYRLVVENDQGDRRELGSYTVTGDAAVPLPIGQLQFSSDARDSGVIFQGSLKSDDASRYIDLSYADPDRKTTELTYSIVWAGNETELVNRTVAGPIRTYSANEPIPDNASGDATFEVNWNAVRDGGDDGSGAFFVGDVPEIATMLGIDPTVLAYASMVGIVAVTGLVVVFDDALAAIVAVVMASGLSLLGAVSIPPVGLAMGGAIAVLYNVGRRT